MFIAVGDDEYQNPNFADYTHDLDFEAHILYKWAEHAPHLSSELRVLNGGHDWDVWAPAFEEGAQYAFQYVARPEVTIMKAKLVGTAGEDREGGVAADAAGNVYEALSAEGTVDGQPNAGAKDVVLIKSARPVTGSGRSSSEPRASIVPTACNSTRRVIP